MSAFRHRREMPVRWVDIDSVGVLNNAVYLTFFEQSRYHYCEDLGLLVAGQFPFVLAETTARYHLPGRAGMVAHVGTRTVRIGHRSLEMEHEVTCEGAVLCTGKAVLVYVDANLKSCPVPEAHKDAIRAYESL